jgi:ribonuclease J
LVGLTVHGGVGEIGGNKVLVEGEHGSVFLDFGLSFKVMARFYSEFCQPRGHCYVGDQISIGMLPDLEGIYRPDLLRKAGRVDPEEPMADAVFISHAHLDHVGMVPVMRPDIPVHISPGSMAILSTLDTVSMAFGMPDKFLRYSHKFTLVESSRGGLRRGKGEEVREPRDVRTFTTVDEVPVSRDLAVRPLAVDHSLPGAAGFLVHVDGRTWMYTGDLRFHGTNAHLTRAFVDTAASEDVDVLVTEGTRVNEGVGRSEVEVKEKVTELVQGARGLVLANYPARDLDRILSFYAAAREAGRELVVDTRQALLLENMHTALGGGVPRLGDGIKVFARRQGWGVVGDDDFPHGIQTQDYKKWEQPFVFSDHRLLDEDIHGEQDRYVVFLDFFHLQALMDIRPDPGAVFIRSLVEPFNEEMELDEERVRNWMRMFELDVHQVHASGHASGDDLRSLVETVEPRIVVPIHTEVPEKFREFHGDVRLPELGSTMDL